MFQILLINEKSELIKSLLNDINENKYNWNENVKALALQTIKVLGRDTKGCDYLFSEEGFKILLNHADNIISQESLTCIANSLLLKDSTRNLFEKYNSQFLLSRILFIITVSSLSATKQLVDDLGIIDVLYKNISNIVKELSSLDYDSKKESSSPYTNEMILNEQLKLLFNLMMNYPKLASLYHCNNDDKENNNDKGKVKENNTKFDILLPPILEIILELKPPSPLPLSPPHSHAIHALLNFPVELILFPTSTSSQSTNQQQQQQQNLPKSSKKKSNNNDQNNQYLILYKLIDILKTMIFITIKGDPDSVINEYDKYDVDFDETITPLIVLLKRLAEGNQTAKLILRNNLLPDDVTKPLEKGDSLSARLIRVMTSVLLPNLKESISNLLFTLCDEDAHLFVHHVGYGNAAGFLMTKNILIPPPPSTTSSSSPSSSITNSSSKSNISNSSSSKPINPITGQYYENEKPSLSLSNMTDEEKEREAEKLFVLFDRLKKTGVMNVVDPIEAAIKSVRFPIILQNEDIAGLVLEALKMMRVDDSALPDQGSVINRITSNGGRDIDNKSMVFIFQKVEHLADCAHGFPVWTRRQIEFPDIAHAVIRINKLLASGSFEVEKCD
ncbi:14584_t:CDS:10 [Entrophospora sp. SA101]|nr:14584_t:CDS:10 [Entrophospora sp. SA101]